MNIGPDEGLKAASAIHCDTIMNLDKRHLTDYIGSLGTAKLTELNRALAVALDLP